MNRGQYFIAAELVKMIHQNFGGFHPGYRDVHADGRYYSGTFTATPEAKKLSRAVHLQGEPVPVTVRYSINPLGDPWGPVSSCSMATRFYLPDGTTTDVIALQMPLFPTRTPEETLEVLKAVRSDTKPGSSDPEKIKQVAAAKPWIGHAISLITQVPSALSLAQTEFHAIHAFRFVNAADEAQYARYHWEPEAGVVGQTLEELQRRPPTYLYDELEERLRKGQVQQDLVLQLASEGDPTDDPNAPWPDDRPRVKIGQIALTRTTTVEEIGAPVMMHDPTRLTDGIEASDDPILAARRGIYELSRAYRTGGWKGRMAALERGQCPFE